jgi:ribosomal protein S12 methylthiotransferase accessory factor YcaO
MNRNQLVSFLPNLKEIQESSFVVAGEEIAFQSSVVLNDGYCIGSGFSQNKITARKIALFEAIERKAFFNIYKSELKSAYLADEFPTTCGFAVGTDAKSARDRALAEAVERWLRSKWIDEGYALVELPLQSLDLNSIEKHFIDHFEEVRLFVHSCEIEVDQTLETVDSVIVVGLTTAGAFVGSKSILNDKAPLLSALVEAWRHLRLSESVTQKDPEMAVIKYFAKNKDVALYQISVAKKSSLSNPELRILKEVDIPIEGVYCFRALCKDFRGWHGDEVTRFVY